MAEDILKPDEDLGNGYMLRHLPEGDYTYPKGIPVEASDDLNTDPFAIAAARTRQSVKGRERLPIDPEQPYKPPSYLMGPDLLEAQQGQHMPEGIALNDAGIPFNKLTGEEVPTARRSNVLPIAREPGGGITLAMPKVLDIVGNVVGGKVPMAGGEVALGSGLIRKGLKLTPVEHDPFSQPFFSALEKAVDDAKIGKGDAQQWLGYLKNQPGVKSEELQTVLGDLKGSLTKDQVQEAVKNNKVELGEVSKGKKSGVDVEDIVDNMMPEEINSFKENKGRIPNENEQAQLRQQIRQYVNQNPDEHGIGLVQDETKFDSYQLPGGENYKETLLTLPNQKLTEDEARIVLYAPPNTKLSKADIEYAERKAANEFKSSHWDEPNVIAHIRHNDRMVDGKKTLHLEELQSDWHQKGRKEGYIQKDLEQLKKTGEAIDDKLIKAKAEDIMANPDLEAGLKTAVERKIISQKEADDYLRLTKNENSTVPDAPFKKNWDELALKRMLHKAANEGYEGLSWTPGEAQAARYDLSRQISKITYNGPGTKAAEKFGTVLKAYDHNGNEIINKALKPEELADHIGKDVAKKLLETEKKADKHELSGLDLKIGGEGMKTFYDKMLVDKANSLVKKYGSKVEKRFINNPQNEKTGSVTERAIGGYNAIYNGEGAVFNNKVDAQKWIDERKSNPIHYLPITPELRAKAKSGFPLFSSVPITVPVDFDPWKDNKVKRSYSLVPVQHDPFK